MTNRTAPQLRADAAVLHAQADALDLDRQAAVVADDATRAWTLRARSATLRAEARFATAHADHLDAQAETVATGLLVPMTRETGGTVEVPADHGMGEFVAKTNAAVRAARARVLADRAETDAPIVWCDSDRHPATGHTQRLNCLRPCSTPDGGTLVAPLTRADLDALPENPGQSAREALNLLRIGDTGGEPDQLAGEVLRYFDALERRSMCDPTSPDFDPDVDDAVARGHW
jgi:hypothetical protein